MVPTYGVYVPCFRPVPGIPFKYRDIHDNLKDNQLSNSVQNSAQSSASGELAGIGTSTGNISTSDNAVVQNSGNTSTTTTFIDPGAIAAGVTLGTTAITSSEKGTEAAADVLKYAITEQTKLAQSAQSGQINALAKTAGWFAVALAGIYAVVKVLGAVFGGGSKKKEAA